MCTNQRRRERGKHDWYLFHADTLFDFNHFYSFHASVCVWMQICCWRCWKLQLSDNHVYEDEPISWGWTHLHFHVQQHAHSSLQKLQCYILWVQIKTVTNCHSNVMVRYSSGSEIASVEPIEWIKIKIWYGLSAHGQISPSSITPCFILNFNMLVFISISSSDESSSSACKNM